MAMLTSIFTRNNDGTQVSATAASAAYDAWVAKNCTSSIIMSAKYNLGQMARYFKILKREGKLPIS